MFSPGHCACCSHVVTLRYKAALPGVNFVANAEDLQSIVPSSSTWVFGTRSLVVQVLWRTDIPDLQIFELVRSDTGHWMIPAHARSLHLRYLNRSVLGHIVEIRISTPPMSFIFEHEGWQRLNFPLVRFRIVQLNAQNGFFEVQMDQVKHLVKV